MLPSTRRARSAETRVALLEAGAQVFVERGFHGASARQIAERAGFTNPVLYYHFGGKEELYAEIIRGTFARLRSLVSEAMAQAAEPLARLRAIALVHLRFAIEQPVRLRMMFAELFRPSTNEPGPDFDEQRDWLLRLIDDVLREGAQSGAFAVAEPATARQLLRSLLGGLLMEQARNPDVRVLDESFADAVVEAFAHGIAGARRSP